MLKPKALRFGDTIGIVAPASPSTEKKVKSSFDQITALGYRVKLGKSCYDTHGYLAGSDGLRAGDLNSMFKDKEVKGIICLRGGYGATKILNRLDLEAIRNNPKVFMGYSDITALHIVLNQLCNLITFHGPMAASDIAEGLDNFTRESFLKIISNRGRVGLIKNPNNNRIICLVEGEATGRIVGGNLTMITATMGTPYEIDTKGKLLFLEDIGEAPYRVDRMLTQLDLAGKIDDAAGFILGDFKNCQAPKDQKSLSLMEVFQEILIPYKKPTIYNLKAGHCSPMITLPLGAKGRLRATEGKLFIEEAATS